VGVLIFIIVVGVIIWLFKKGREQAALNKSAQDAFMSEHAGWDVFVLLGQAVIALNHDSGKIVLGTIGANKQYPWSAIASVEVIRDGTSITSTNRGSQLMGAAIGDVLLGPVGLLLGGVTGSKRTVQRVSQIALKIIVDDRFTPVYSIDFLRVPGTGADPRNKLVKDAAQRAEHVHALLVNVIRNSSIQLAAVHPQITERSAAERIDQLWRLKESGALTDIEFQQQKQQILGVLQPSGGGAR
jgi:hypothetical protein